MSGQPYLKFYPGDWQSDECVSLLSLAARGLWMEMLLIMHKGGGYLRTNGQGLTPPLLARMVRADSDHVERLLEELETAGVFSRNEHGIIYSRRILRDIAKAEVARENGKLGGNPLLMEGLTKPPTPPVKRKITPGDKAHGARHIHPSEKESKKVQGVSSPRVKEDGILENYWMDGREVLTGEPDAEQLLARLLDDEQDTRRAQTRLGHVAKSRVSRPRYIAKLRRDLAVRFGVAGLPADLEAPPPIQLSDALQQNIKRMVARR